MDDNGRGEGQKDVPVVIESVTGKESSGRRNVPKQSKPPHPIIKHFKKMEQLTWMDGKAEAEVSRTVPEPRKHKGWKHFWKSTMADMRNKHLIPVKTLFFFKAATLFVLYPFLTLHIKSLGLDAAEAGINSAFIPIVAILASPFAGIIADKIGNFKILLATLTFANAGLALLLLLVPVARETILLPDSLTFALGCSSPQNNSNQSAIGSFTLNMMGETTCTVDLSSAPWDNILTSPVQCGTLCPVLPSNVDKSYPTVTSLPLNSTLNKIYVLAGKRATFQPLPNQRPDLVCSGRENNTCFLALGNVTVDEEMRMETHISQLSLGDPDGSEGSRPYVENVTSLSYPINGRWGFGKYNFSQVPTCMGITNGPGTTLNGSNKNKCREECLVNFNRSLFCSNTQETIIYDVSLTFWLYTIFRVILGLSSAMTWIMFEGAVLAILKENGGDYGLQRVTAAVASIIVSPVSGALIYYFQDFRPAFYLYAILQTVSALLTLRIDLTFKKPTEKILGHLKNVLSQTEIIVFFVAMLISGSVWGYLESFLFWFLKNLGGSEILMGLTISVGGLAGLPFLISSRVIIKKLGHVNVLCLGLLFYCIRLLGYSIIEDPWLSLPFEAMEAVTVFLAITAAATYASVLSTEQTIASIQGVMGALYFGFGRGIGSLIGGFFIKWYGERVTFQLFAVASLVSCLLYFILNLVYIRKNGATRINQELSGGGGGEGGGDGGDGGKLSTPINVQMRSEGENKEIIGEGEEEEEGGYVGPCDVNIFTDVPLDEEPGSLSPKLSSRPASFPQKSKTKVAFKTSET